MQQLEQRIARLEKSLSLYRIFFTIIILGGFSFALMSSDKSGNAPDLIQAKKFQVVDNNGKVIAELGPERGNGALNTYTPSGKRLVSLFNTDANAGAISAYDADGDVTFKVTNTVGGGGYLALYNEVKKEIVEFGVTKASGGYLRVNDRNGDKLGWLTYTENGGGYFSLYNNGKEATTLAATRQGGRFSVYNNNDKRVGYVGAQDNLDGFIGTYNSSGEYTGSIPK